ncbi:hypothetical protein LTR56_017810 [Elasticomyces elasticus]|nr:hypothetical protein LTR22_022037 [Elasticomyces elasticus]KAK3629797.1 hypothetical protein LTR56_017810 [Elasticomyces elasticus]KAK4917491.1 hypothetical protein LTR49_014577 [Elasticomyces elasticus]KAK5756385.1 hypothetical protein LTS12_013574 [Elasticomyces elasticus]
MAFTTTEEDKATMLRLGQSIITTSHAVPREPRTMPAPKVENAPLFARPSAPEVRITPPAYTTAPSTTSTSTGTTPMLTERNLNVSVAASVPSLKEETLDLLASPALTTSSAPTPVTTKSAGPSLFGGEDRLKEAREFARATSHGKLIPAHITSKGGLRRTAARDMLTATRPFPSPITSPTVATAPVSAWQGFGSGGAALHNRPPVSSLNTPRAAPSSPASTFLSTTTPNTSTKNIFTAPAMPNSNTMDTSIEKPKLLFSFEEIADTTPKAKTALHLLAKAAKDAAKLSLASNSTEKPTTEIAAPKQTATAEKTVAPVTEKPVPAPKPTAFTTSTTATVPQTEAKVENTTPTAAPAATFAVAEKPIATAPTPVAAPTPQVQPKPAVAKDDGTKTKPIVIEDGSSASVKSDISLEAFTGMQQQMAALRTENAELKQSFDNLENVHRDLSLKIEEVISYEQKRKFLGTDQAKVPYNIQLTFPDGNILGLQVTRETRIGGVIRSACTHKQLLPSKTKNPRLYFNGTDVGHMVMCGEAGIFGGAKTALGYDGAPAVAIVEETEESDEEL